MSKLAQNIKSIKTYRLCTLLAAAICGIALLSALSIGSVLSYSYFKSLKAEFHDRVRAEGEVHSLEVYSFLNRAMSRLGELSRDNSIRVTMMLGADYPLIEKLEEYDQSPLGVDYFILRKGDDKIFSSTSKKFDSVLVRQALENTPYRCTFCRSSDGKLVTVFSVPIRSRLKVVGSVACIVDASKSRLDSLVDSSTGGRLILFNQGIASDFLSGKPLSLEVNDAISDEMVHARLGDKLEGALFRSSLVPGLSYFVSDERLFKVISKAFYLSLPFIIIISGICMFVALFISRKLGQPLQTITETVESVSKGMDVAINDKDSHIHEIGTLEKSLSYLLESLRRAKGLEAYQFYFDNVSDLVCITDIDGLFIETNVQITDQLGYSKEELLSKTIFELVPAYERASLRAVLSDILGGSATDSFECSMITKTGRSVYSEVRTRKIKYHGADVLLSVVRDATDRKNDEEELQRYAAELLRANEVEERNSAHMADTLKQLEDAMARAEVASRTKSSFLAQMSHEIRTPMNSILGMADMLRETPLDAEQNSYVNIFQDSGVVLMDLINDILDLSKIEAGELSIEKTEFNLDRLVDEVSGIMSVTAWKKGLDLDCHIDPSVPSLFVGDPTRMKQIIINLLSNAIKFTDIGTISLGITSRFVDDGKVLLKMVVTDTGIGIPEENVDLLFENFTQADSSTTRKFGGTGLGLAITKNLVELMGGTISALNGISGGAQFNVEVVVHMADSLDLQMAEIEKAVRGKTLLVVDQSPVVRTYICACLEKWGAACILAENGISACQKIKKTNKKIDLIIISEKFGDSDGLGEVDAIKECMTFSKPDVCLLSLSPGESYSSPVVNKLFGVKGSIRWPMTRGILQCAMLNVLGNESVECLVKDPEAILLPTRILFAEDSESNRMLVEFYLKDTPFKITSVPDGRTAVDMYKKHNFDLVLMDVNMPVLDGYAATKEIRYYERKNGYPNTPIVILTANEISEDIQHRIEYGYNGYITKPIKKIALVRNVLKFTS
ncbi:PAS domain-containing hybrid sensor histidine kinase/response regulator [Maridesulfovibrio frigidus]|uniref:PAS domain-containing hybrid sensor histidine kinase/response regulator n=1 Tax=Maridesulfovibrio frigidus TaxID=340956 RepID=UPI001F323C52|nr:response regulator [Maridesulfovibrio frigidus]